MKINVDELALTRFLDAEMDSEALDGLVNAVFLSLNPNPKQAKSIIDTLGAANAYRKMALENMSLEQKELFATIAIGFGLDEIQETPINEILDNPYYQALMKLEPFKEGDISFFFEAFQPYRLFLSEDKGQDEAVSSQEKTYLSYFSSPIAIPTLSESKLRWMSLHPHEIHTMKDSIARAKGNILIYGAGMGYFAYMCALKEEVASLTIVESNPKIITLLKEKFMPLFPKGKPITIIQGDALAYAKKRDVHYDYCFVDIYRGENDGILPYCELKASEGIADTQDYWIEQSLLAYLRRHLCVYLEEQYYEGYGEEAYQEKDTISNILLASIFDIHKTTLISTEEELTYFLSDAHLKILAKEIGKRC